VAFDRPVPAHGLGRAAAVKPLFDRACRRGFALLVGGGLAYTLNGLYLGRRIPFHHAGGTAVLCGGRLLFAVLLFVIPRG
jgi:hypothetical protein